MPYIWIIAAVLGIGAAIAFRRADTIPIKTCFMVGGIACVSVMMYMARGLVIVIVSVALSLAIVVVANWPREAPVQLRFRPLYQEQSTCEAVHALIISHLRDAQVERVEVNAELRGLRVRVVGQESQDQYYALPTCVHCCITQLLPKVVTRKAAKHMATLYDHTLLKNGMSTLVRMRSASLNTMVGLPKLEARVSLPTDCATHAAPTQHE